MNLKRGATSPYATDDARWTAVLNRDRKADGQFVYAVKTTGVYCRPSCPSRRARRQNVVFHPSGEAARAAGFRPCKRCAPDGRGLHEERVLAVATACRMIETSEEMPNLPTLASAAGLSPFHFHRVFREQTGLTPKAYGQAHRARRIREELPKRQTVTEAIYGAGFNSNGRFYAGSTPMLGMKPSHFRQGGTGEVISFAVGECSLGSILVASSKKGVCAVALGADPEQLVRELQDRFPNAQLRGGDAPFEQLVAKVVGLVEAPRVGLDLPLDVRGTAFQQRVWQALRQVPPGQTVSYTELAARVGMPRAVRAVARACAANTIAVAIPCHRVVRTNGSLSGYRWGVERKRTLLQRESAA